MRFLAQLLLCWVLTAVLSGASAAEVTVVSSERTAGYMEALDVLVAELARLNFPVSDVDLLAGGNLAALLAQQKPKLIVTLGTESLRQVLAQESRVPVLAALIPRISFERVVRTNVGKVRVAALYLDQPIARQLDLVRLAFPAAQRIGVLFGGESIAQRAVISAAATARNLTTVNGMVGPTHTVASALSEALDGADIFLAVPDPQVFNPNTVANVLMSTYRAHVPVMGFSPAYVRAGAALSLHTSPAQVGVQTAVLVRQFMQSGALPASQYSADFSVSVNERVAHSMGLQLDTQDLVELLKRMERKP